MDLRWQKLTAYIDLKVVWIWALHLLKLSTPLPPFCERSCCILHTVKTLSTVNVSNSECPHWHLVPLFSKWFTNILLLSVFFITVSKHLVCVPAQPYICKIIMYVDVRSCIDMNVLLVCVSASVLLHSKVEKLVTFFDVPSLLWFQFTLCSLCHSSFPLQVSLKYQSDLVKIIQTVTLSPFYITGNRLASNLCSMIHDIFSKY